MSETISGSPTVAAALGDAHALVVRYGLCGRIWCERCQSWDHECGCKPRIDEQAMADLEAAIQSLIDRKVEECAEILDGRASGFRARADTIYNGRIVAGELSANAAAIRKVRT